MFDELDYFYELNSIVLTRPTGSKFLIYIALVSIIYYIMSCYLNNRRNLSMLLRFLIVLSVRTFNRTPVLPLEPSSFSELKFLRNVYVAIGTNNTRIRLF